MSFNTFDHRDEEFETQRNESLEILKKDQIFDDVSKQWLRLAGKNGYFYNFDWLGRPIIQIPHDIYALQDIMWRVNPDLIIETGIARGGSLIFSASMLALLDYCDCTVKQKTIDPKMSKRKVLGIDIDIRDHNRKAIEAHPLAHLIDLRESSSTTTETEAFVCDYSKKYEKVMVVLDSNHTKDHVLKELEIFAPLVTIGSYCIVMDTSIDFLSPDDVTQREWGPHNNPRQAVYNYLSRNHSNVKFEVDEDIQLKIAVTGACDGFLRRVK